jgi:hypothetical protein
MSGGALVRPGWASRSAAELAGEEELARLQAELLELPFYPGPGYGWTAHHRCRRVQVPAVLRRGVELGAGRVAGCYAGAFRYVAAHADQEVRLVHGWVWEPAFAGGPLLPWSHAWAELPGQDAVFEPVVGLLLDRGDYQRAVGATPLAVYTPAEAIRRAEEAGHAAGTWAEGHAAHQVAERRALAVIDAEVPGLRGWVQAMLEADPGFAAGFRLLVEVNSIFALHVLVGLADRGDWQRWRPGIDGPWPHPLHPTPGLTVRLPWTTRERSDRQGGA